MHKSMDQLTAHRHGIMHDFRIAPLTVNSSCVARWLLNIPCLRLGLKCNRVEVSVCASVKMPVANAHLVAVFNDTLQSCTLPMMGRLQHVHNQLASGEDSLLQEHIHVSHCFTRYESQHNLLSYKAFARSIFFSKVKTLQLPAGFVAATLQTPTNQLKLGLAVASDYTT